MSQETLNEYGSLVAHQVRFDSSRTSHTAVVFATEGILLRQLTADPLLSQVGERVRECDVEVRYCRIAPQHNILPFHTHPTRNQIEHLPFTPLPSFLSTMS